MAVDDKVVVGQTHAADDPEAVLIGYLLGVEALRAGKQVVMWLTKDGVHLATDGYSDGVSVPDVPVDQGPARRVRRKGRTVLRLPGVCEDAQARRCDLGHGSGGQGRGRRCTSSPRAAH